MTVSKGKNYLFTSESVTEGHPDKVADQISDSILDSILEKDPNGRVACESLVLRSCERSHGLRGHIGCYPS